MPGFVGKNIDSLGFRELGQELFNLEPKLRISRAGLLEERRALSSMELRRVREGSI